MGPFNKRRKLIACLALALLVGACGRATPAVVSERPLAARALGDDGYEAPQVLENFKQGHSFYPYTPEFHLFYAPLIFTEVGLLGGRNRAVEVLAPAGEQVTRKGHYVTYELEHNSFMPPSVASPPPGGNQPAPHVRLGFRWNVNAPTTTPPAIMAEAVFMLTRKTEDAFEPLAIAYAWTNPSYRVGQVLKSTIMRASGPPIPLRILVLRNTLPLERPCGAEVLDDMLRHAEVERRDLEVDLVRILAELPLDAAPPAPICNEDILGIHALGVGADIPGNVCAHALLDDFTVQLKWQR